MTYDLIPVLRHVIQSLEPFATSQEVQLHFSTSIDKLSVHQEADELLLPVFTLLARLLKYIPTKEEVNIRVEAAGSQFSILIQYSGSDLSRVMEIHNHIRAGLVINQYPSKQSFQLNFPLVLKDETIEKEPAGFQTVKLPLYYAEIRKRLTTYFTRSENLVNTLTLYNTRDAIFLKKLNTLVIENIENPQLDANYLSDAMHMSRTQLFRKLKPIIRQSPGHYIKSLKLQKAKELFETTDLRVGEVAYKTGFESPGNFTRAFTRQFGFCPSLLCKGKDGTKG